MSLGFTFNAYVKNSLVLTQEQFNTVIAAIGEGLIPVPQQRPPRLPKNPVEDIDELHALLLNSKILSDISVLNSRITSQQKFKRT